jgi:hypothetical protein
MTNEEQLRASLLGGGQITTFWANPRHSLNPFHDQEPRFTALHTQKHQVGLGMLSGGIIRLPDATIQGVVFEAKTSGGLNRANYEVQEQAILIASQSMQWQSVRKYVLDRLQRLFVFRERSSVISFLEKNFFLTPLLLQANENIGEFFGLVRVVLEVSSDPDNGNQELWVRIQTRMTPEEGLSILTRFDQEWWLDASSSSQNLLNIKLEYV